MRAFLGLAIVSLALTATPLASKAQEVTLKMATLSPPNSIFVTGMLKPWADRVNKKGKGILRIQLVNGTAVANFRNVYGRVLSDVVQIGWGGQTLVGGKFPRSDVATLPFQSDASASVKSAALYRIYESGPLAKEYDEIVPLALIVIPGYGFHFAEKPKSVSSLKGIKVNIYGSVPADMVRRLDGVPISLPITKTYEALRRGTVHATTLAWTSFPQFRLAEVTKYHLEGHFGNNTGMFFMSRAKFNSLPPAAQRLLKENSGEGLSAEFGVFWEKLWRRARAKVVATPGHTIVTMNKQQQAAWAAKVRPVVEKWVKATPDGQKTLDLYKKAIADIKMKK
jgi:TRAP-type C4-dicarboxylate transport system substrate-binding protein